MGFTSSSNSLENKNVNSNVSINTNFFSSSLSNSTAYKNAISRSSNIVEVVPLEDMGFVDKSVEVPHERLATNNTPPAPTNNVVYSRDEERAKLINDLL